MGTTMQIGKRAALGSSYLTPILKDQEHPTPEGPEYPNIRLLRLCSTIWLQVDTLYLGTWTSGECVNYAKVSM